MGVLFCSPNTPSGAPKSATLKGGSSTVRKYCLTAYLCTIDTFYTFALRELTRKRVQSGTEMRHFARVTSPRTARLVDEVELRHLRDDAPLMPHFEQLRNR